MVFVSKLRPLGSSSAVIVPKAVLQKEGLKIGQEVRVAIINQDFTLLDELMGTMKDAKPFVRDRRDRI